MANETSPKKLLSEDTLRQILQVLPLDAVVKFREQAKIVHHKQMDLINAILLERGYIEPHMGAPPGGYSD